MKRPNLITSPNFVCYLENDEMIDKHFSSLQRAFKKLGFKGARLVKHPRHSDRKGLFNGIGKRYSGWTENHPPYKHAEYFGIYVKWENFDYTGFNYYPSFNGRMWFNRNSVRISK